MVNPIVATISTQSCWGSSMTVWFLRLQFVAFATAAQQEENIHERVNPVAGIYLEEN
jgi:hypothetical protein